MPKKHVSPLSDSQGGRKSTMDGLKFQDDIANEEDEQRKTSRASRKFYRQQTLDIASAAEEGSNKKSMQKADARMDFAVVETHVQKYVLNLMEPSILRVTQQQLEIDGLRNSSEKHSKLLQDIAVISAKAEQQIQTVEHFRGQMAEWDNLRLAQEGKVKEDISTMRHELDSFRYDLERKESSIHGMQRTCDRLVGEANRMHDMQSSLQKYCEERVNSHSKLISRNRTELEAKQISLEQKHNKLSDQVWGEETNLKKVSTELKKNKRSRLSAKRRDAKCAKDSSYSDAA